MITITISARGWDTHQKAAEHLIRRAIEAGTEYTLVLDESVIDREAKTDHETGALEAHFLNFGDWLKDGYAEDGILDFHRIRNLGKTLSPVAPVIVDVRGRRPDLVASALTQLRYAWFPLDHWHPVFALICDDQLLLAISPLLANTFYCQPQILTDRELTRIVKQIQRTASVHRWLGPGGGGWQKRAFSVLKYFSAIADKREVKRERRRG